MANALTDELDRLTNAAGTAGYTPVDWTAYYDKQYQAKLDALNASYQAQKQQLQAQLPKIEQAYDAQRGNVYTGARRSALGNNEVLAAQGLAGNAYKAPTSGYAETSRVNQDTSMRNILNFANLQQQKAFNDIDTQIASAGVERDSQLAQALYEIEQSKLANIQGENQYASGYTLEQAAQQEAIRQYNEQMAMTNQQNALSQAYQELMTFGRIVTQAAADALGVKVGATLKQLKR